MSASPADEIRLELDVVPNVRTPRVIGTLNIVFASGLMLCGLCGTFYFIFLPMMKPMVEAQQKQMQGQTQAERKAQIEALRTLEEHAKTDDEQEQFAARRRSLEAAPADAFDMDFMWGLDDPRVAAYYLTDGISGLVLNLAMLVAGVGLVRLGKWGRLAGLWVAALKITRLVLVYGFFIGVVAPIHARHTADMFEKMLAQQRGAAPPPAPAGKQIGAVYGTMMTGYAIGMIVVGSIYPGVTLWLLTRPGVRVACRGAELGPAEVQ